MSNIFSTGMEYFCMLQSFGTWNFHAFSWFLHAFSSFFMLFHAFSYFFMLFDICSRVLCFLISVHKKYILPMYWVLRLVSVLNLVLGLVLNLVLGLVLNLVLGLALSLVLNRVAGLVLVLNAAFG